MRASDQLKLRDLLQNNEPAMPKGFKTMSTTGRLRGCSRLKPRETGQHIAKDASGPGLSLKSTWMAKLEEPEQGLRVRWQLYGYVSFPALTVLL